MEFNSQLCILLLVTEKEYDAGSVDKCILKYFVKQVSRDKKIDLYVYFNKGNADKYKNLLEYKNLQNINDIFISSLNLNDAEDIYARTPKEFSKLKWTPDFTLGGSTGPNNLFYRSFDNFFELNYRDILMLETDSQPIQDFWLDKIINYCDQHRFLIAGSIYKGKQKFSIYEVWAGHLNGIAIYRNSPFLKKFIKESKKLIEYNVKKNMNHYMSFDVAMHQLYSGLFGRWNCHDQLNFDNHLIDTKIISNFSLPIDKNTTIESVKQQYPQTIILHKK